MKRLVLCSGFLLTLSACYFGGGVVCDAPPPTPLFSVVSANSVSSGDSIRSVTFSDFVFDGTAVEAETLFSFDLVNDAYSGDDNAEFEDGTVVCSLPCSFGFEAEEGSYSFGVSAEGYQTQRIDVDAKYEKLPPSKCGSGRGTLVELEFELTPTE